MLRSNSIFEGSCYASESSAKWVAAGILHKSYSLFSETRIIKNLEKLLAPQATRVPSINPDNPNDFTFELSNVFIDKITILTAFENIIKAKLLLKGFVIHRIDSRAGGGKLTTLRKKQRVTPLRIQEVLSKEGIDRDSLSDFTLNSLDIATLDMEFLLGRQSYLHQGSLPEQLTRVLKKFLKDEKTLDFLAPKEHYGSAQNLQNFKILKNYISSAVVDEYNQLATEMEFPASQLIRRS